MQIARNNPLAISALCACGWAHSEPKDGEGNFDVAAFDAAVTAHWNEKNPPHPPRETHLNDDLTDRS